MHANRLLAAFFVFVSTWASCARGQDDAVIVSNSLTGEFLWAVLAGIVLATAGCVVDATLKKVITARPESRSPKKR